MNGSIKSERVWDLSDLDLILDIYVFTYMYVKLNDTFFEGMLRLPAFGFKVDDRQYTTCFNFKNLNNERG